MDLQAIADELMEGMKTGQEGAKLETLYAPDAVSVEALDFGQGRETKGIEGIRGKHAWWDSTFEVLEADYRGPFPNGPDRFAVCLQIKTHNKQTDAVEEMSEVALYTVADGKIVREEFFYGS